jgi:hypothetical protein
VPHTQAIPPVLSDGAAVRQGDEVTSHLASRGEADAGRQESIPAAEEQSEGGEGMEGRRDKKVACQCVRRGVSVQ